jgi:hypothetical protein
MPRGMSTHKGRDAKRSRKMEPFNKTGSLSRMDFERAISPLIKSFINISQKSQRI